MKVFSMILETNRGLLKHTGVFKNKKDAQLFTSDNEGELIVINDVTYDFKVNLVALEETLLKNGYGEIEVELITSILQNSKENCYRG